MIPHDETMMLKTPFHSRIEAACEINMWEDWKGYTSPQAYTEVEQEYFAVRFCFEAYRIVTSTTQQRLCVGLASVSVRSMQQGGQATSRSRARAGQFCRWPNASLENK